MKTKHRIGIVLGLFCLQLGGWGYISDNSNLLWLAGFNAVFLAVLFGGEIITTTTGGKITPNKLLAYSRPLIIEYGITLVSILLLWFLVSWLVRGIGSGSFFIALIIWIGFGFISRRSFFKDGMLWGSNKISNSGLLLIVSGLVTITLLSQSWFMKPSLLYPLAIGLGLLVYTLGLEIIRVTNQGNKRRKLPIWLLYLCVFGATLVWAGGRFALDWVDDHTIEKIVIEEKTIYVPIDSGLYVGPALEGLDAASINENSANEEDTKDLEVNCGPAYSLCNEENEQGRECIQGRVQDGNDCVEVAEVVIVAQPKTTTTTRRVVRPVFVPAPVVETEKQVVEIPVVKKPEIEPTTELEDGSILSPGSYLRLRSVLGTNEEYVPSEQDELEAIGEEQPVIIEEDLVETEITTVEEFINIPTQEPVVETLIIELKDAIKDNNFTSVSDLLQNSNE